MTLYGSMLDPQRLPRHVAIIMDGNGRWAKQRKRPRLYGHKVGADSVSDIVRVCRELGIGYLTLYAFSSENWQRPSAEVSGLMSILQKYLQGELSRMQKNGIRLLSIGDRCRLPDSVRLSLEETIAATADNTNLTLNLALSYGSRDELVRAVRKIAESCIDNNLDPQKIVEATITDTLDTAGMPDPDLLIRTGGEARLSNFLLWQASYAEISFSEVMWPDFREQAFLQILQDFQKRERRFGRTGDQLQLENSS